MTMKVVWSPGALDQLGWVAEYIGSEDPAARWRVHDRVVGRVAQLAHFPELGRPGRLRGTRELVIAGTAYVVVYRVTSDAIEIAAVWHSAQSRR